MVRKKSTILRQIKAGKLSATRHDNGQWKIEPAELARVHGAVATEATGAAQRGAPADAAPAPDGIGAIRKMLAELQQQVADLRHGRADLREQIADLRADRDHWRGIAERLALPKPETTAAQVVPLPGPRPVPAPPTWWRGWLRSS
jgi:hypothetical protein